MGLLHTLIAVSILYNFGLFRITAGITTILCSTFIGAIHGWALNVLWGKHLEALVMPSPSTFTGFVEPQHHLHLPLRTEADALPSTFVSVDFLQGVASPEGNNATGPTQLQTVSGSTINNSESIILWSLEIQQSRTQEAIDEHREARSALLATEIGCPSANFVTCEPETTTTNSPIVALAESTEGPEPIV